MELAVETEALSKTYRGRIQALKALDLKVPAGSAFGLLGPNGAGKSTLVKALLSIVRPTSGEGRILGCDIRSHEARRGVGYLPEGHRFPRYLTGRGVCRYFGRLAGLHGHELKREVDEKLAVVGMTEWADTKISKYSKGMAQRVGLAQAMLGKPRLVFLDEPTDGVDPVGRAQIRDVIRDLCKKNVTVFLNSHLLAEVEQICDRVAIMHHGTVLQQGSVEEVRAAMSDGGKLHVRFSTGPLNDDARKRLDKLGSANPVPEGVVLSLGNREQIPQAIDALRQAGVAIYAVEPARASLEDAFIQLIHAQADQSLGGTR